MTVASAFTFLASRYPEDDDKAQFTAFHPENPIPLN